MLFKNAKIVLPTKMVEGSVLVEGTRISKIKRTIAHANGEDVIDCKGKLLLPGCIDAHVHFRDPGAEQKEDFFTGSTSALCGGITSVFDMPNTNPSTSTLAALESKLAIASAKSACDFAFFFGASTDNVEEAARAGERSYVAGLKMYMGSSTGNLLVSELEGQLAHFAAFPENKVLAVHAESEQAMKFFLSKFSQDTVASHNKVRNALVSAIATSQALRLAEAFKRKLHVCHCSTAKELELVAQARKRGALVTAETTPHHVFLNDGALVSLKNFGRVNPPLRTKEEQLAMWKSFALADMIASDHAPHTREEKEQPYAKAPSGMPGVETMLPVFLDAALRGKMDVVRVVRMLSANPARIFGIQRKGIIHEGFDADIVLVDPKKERVLTGQSLHSKCGWTPFEGRTVKGVISQVYLRGTLVVEDNESFAQKGNGKPLHIG